MKHEDVKVEEQYTINKDAPFNSLGLDKGEQVVVVNEIPSGFISVQSKFEVRSLRYYDPRIPVPTWIVSHEDLEPANPDWVDPYAPKADE